MKRPHRFLLLALATALLTPVPATADPGPVRESASPPGVAEAPEPVSPAGRVELGCPTFSWSAVPGAPGYELVVYRVRQDGEVGEEPLVSARLPGGTSSWTPAGADCLAARGRFAWSLRTLGRGGAPGWSAPVLFEVAAEPSAAEVKAALETLRRYLARSGEAVPEAAAAEELAGGRRAPGAASRAPATPTAPSRRAPARTGNGAAGSAGPSTGALASKAAPGLGTPSLTIDATLALGPESHLFKDGEVFLWDSTVGNTAVGRLALAYAAGAATENTAVGTGALRMTSAGVIESHGSRNTALGYQAMAANTVGFQNTALGHEALSSSGDSSLNTAVGAGALLSNTSGHRNTVGGALALQSNTTGAYNTALGTFTLRDNVAGSMNTAIGYKALRNATGDRNVAIGFNAGISTTDGDDNVYIASGGGSEDSGTIRIGSASQERTFIAGIHGEPVAGTLNEMTVLVDSSGKLGTQVSSRRFKEGIATVGETARRLLELRPVRFRYTAQNGRGPEQFGLIAEEVAEVFPDLVVRDAEGRPLSVRYHLLAPLLLAELQHAYREIEAVRTELAGHREALRGLRERVAGIEP